MLIDSNQHVYIGVVMHHVFRRRMVRSMTTDFLRCSDDAGLETLTQTIKLSLMAVRANKLSVLQKRTKNFLLFPFPGISPSYR